VSVRRILLGLVIGIGLLVLLIAGVGWWVLNTESASRRALAFALGKSPEGLQVDGIRGRLSGPLFLYGIRYRSGGLSAEIDSAMVDLRTRSLLSGEVVLQRVHVTGMRVVLPDSAPPDTAGTARARRERAQPPLRVVIEEGRVIGFEVDGPGDLGFADGILTLAGSLEDYRFSVQGVAMLPNIDTTNIAIAGEGDLQGVRLDSTSYARMAGGRFMSNGTLAWWPMVEWDLNVAIDSLEPSRFLPDPAMVPGMVHVDGNTTGRIDSAGPVGRFQVDSMNGSIRGHPISGQAVVSFTGPRIEHAQGDVQWGSARIRADGAVGDRVDVKYDVEVSNLASFVSGARGSLDAEGRVRGTMRVPRIEANLTGRGVAYAGSSAERVSGRVDIDLSSGGRTFADLRLDSTEILTRAYDRLTVALRGVTTRHTLDIVASYPGDTVRLGLEGGRRGRQWLGQLQDLAFVTPGEDWTLVQPVRLALSPGTARVERLCVAGDSVSGQACAEVDWRSARNWHVLATLDEMGLARIAPRYGFTGFSGVAGGRLEARNTSAGMLATLEARVRDSAGETATLTGRMTLPGYWAGRPVRSQRMVAKVQGQLENLAVLAPLFPAVDSLRGAANLSIDGSGTLAAPHVVGSLTVDSILARFRHRRRLTGAVELAADVRVGPDRSLQGRISLTPTALQLEYQQANRLIERFMVDSGGVAVTAGTEGLRGTIDLTLRNQAGDSLVGVDAELRLPRYTRMGQRLSSQPLSLQLTANVADLGAAQPLAMTMDSLGGTIRLTLTGSGTLGMPNLKGRLEVQNAVLRTATRSVVHGGLNGDLDVTVARDSTIRGHLRLVPENVRLAYANADTTSEVFLRETALEVRAGPDGVRGAFDVTLASEGDSTVAHMSSRAALPRYTRIGRPLAPQPVEATIEGQVDDFAFLPAFVGMVDSAAGAMTVSARVTGTLGQSRLVGGTELEHVAVRLPRVGITLSEINLTARGDQQGEISVNGTVRSGGGEITLKGTTPVQPTSANPGQFELQGENFLAANNGEVQAVITPRLNVRLAEDTIALSGRVDVPLARIELTELPVATIKPSDDVILVNSAGRQRRERPVSVAVRVVLGDSVSFSGFNFDAELGGNLVITQRPDRPPRGTGSLVIEEGHYKAYGQDLTIEDGQIRFAGPLDNPALNIRATRMAGDSVEVGIAMGGTLKEPDVRLFSDEPMSQAQVLSHIITGGPTGGGGSTGNLVSKALNALGLSGGNQILGALGQDIGLDQVQLDTEGDLQTASIVLGRYLRPNLYVSYGIGLFDPVGTLRLRYVLSSRFSLQAETGGRGTGGDVLLKVRK
jgi:autotransporter translocation and assembly factor TamB